VKLAFPIAEQHSDCPAIGIGYYDVRVSVMVHVGDGYPFRPFANGNRHFPELRAMIRRVGTGNTQERKRQAQKKRSHAAS
jgi:hypothetical protein